jgi:hypothetical protein
VPAELTEAVAPSGMVSAGHHALTRRQERHALASAPAPRRPEPDPEPEWELQPQRGEVELPAEPEPLPPLVPADDDGQAGTAGDLPALPRRRSRRGHAVPQGPQVDWPAERDAEEAPEEAGQWMNAFLSGAAAANGDLYSGNGADPHHQTGRHDEADHDPDYDTAYDATYATSYDPAHDTKHDVKPDTKHDAENSEDLR